MNSTFGNRADTDAQTAVLTLHPLDAERRGIVAGDAVRIFNARGHCLLRAELRDTVSPGVVATPSVRWPKRAQGGNTVNMLTSQRLTDKGGGPTFYSCLVEVEKAGD